MNVEEGDGWRMRGLCVRVCVFVGEKVSESERVCEEGRCRRKTGAVCGRQRWMFEKKMRAQEQV